MLGSSLHHLKYALKKRNLRYISIQSLTDANRCMVEMSGSLLFQWLTVGFLSSEKSPDIIWRSCVSGSDEQKAHWLINTDIFSLKPCFTIFLSVVFWLQMKLSCRVLCPLRNVSVKYKWTILQGIVWSFDWIKYWLPPRVMTNTQHISTFNIQFI